MVSGNPNSRSNTSIESLPPPYTEKEGYEKGATNYGYSPYPGDETVVIGVDGPNNTDGIEKTKLELEDERRDEEEEEEEEEEDPWKISTIYIKVVPWEELSTCGKVKRVVWDYFGKIVLLIGFLYLFICSLDFLSNAFRLVGGKAAGSVFSENQVLSNPVAGLMIGVLATVLLQSSSTTTSIVVSMVAAKLIPVKQAIPIVMGANIGTSVTNTLVSIGQITNKNEFRRAFAGATVHDMFNWLTVIVLLPLEVATGYLYLLSDLVIKSLHMQTNENADQDFLKVITEPFTKLIIQVDKKVINDIALGKEDAMNKSMIKHCCEKETVDEGFENETEICIEKCVYLFEGVANSWSDATIGAILLVMALVILCVCLVCIVKTLHSLLKGRIALFLKKFMNADFPGKCAYFTGYLAILVGCGMTILVQSSSIFTSAVTPLVGIGVVSIDRMYPLTLGANIGTTTTSILAALAQSAEDMPLALQIAFCHLFFNISGILLFYPIPYLRFPINMAKFLGNETAKYRWFAVLYLIVLFFLLPGIVFGLSMINWIATVAFVGVLLLIGFAISILKVLQRKRPDSLPRILRDFKFLPIACRSLEPYDKVVSKVTKCLPCCNKGKEDAIDEEKPRQENGAMYGSTKL